jgi:hypothetical protein
MVALPHTAHTTSAQALSKLDGQCIECELPNPNMHNFEGVYVDDGQTLPLTKDQILLRVRCASVTSLSFLRAL